MNRYRFEMTAIVEVTAVSEEEARAEIVMSCQDQDEDVDYNGVAVYLPSYVEMTLTDVMEIEDNE